MWQPVNTKQSTRPDLPPGASPPDISNQALSPLETLSGGLSTDLECPPKHVTNEDVVAAAERIVAALSGACPILEETYNDEHYLLGPEVAKSPFRTPRNRKKLDLLISQQEDLHGNFSSLSSPSNTPRIMTILPRGQAARAHRNFRDFPLASEPFPADFTLRELCRKYPNHLLGDNLIPFMQAGWTAAKIVGFLPKGERVTVGAISARLARLKNTLRLKGELQASMQAEQWHVEGD